MTAATQNGAATQDSCGLGAADRVALAALEAALVHARETDDARSPFAVVAASLADLGFVATGRRPTRTVVADGRDEWLRRVRSSGRSESSVYAYRAAIDDLLDWAQRSSHETSMFEETAIVSYLDDYRSRCRPAEATYHRRFLLLRRFIRWLGHRHGLPDPFAELDAPPRPRQHGDWLTRDEFARLLEAASNPSSPRPGLAERDRLVLLALVTTGLRRSELIALDWRDLDLDVPRPSLLVRRGKGGKPRPQPISTQLAVELRDLRRRRDPAQREPVFCGLAGGRLQPTILADIIRRASERAGIDKRVTAHTLRHTAATWLRQDIGDTRLVAEYLGHADLSTVSRYAHVAPKELHDAAEILAEAARLRRARPDQTRSGQLAFDGEPLPAICA